MSQSQVYDALFLCWKRGLVLRTERPIYEYERVFKGRGGVRQHKRPCHIYMIRPEGMGDMRVNGNVSRVTPRNIYPEAS